MGLFSKLKEIFSKKSLESFKEVEQDLEKIKNKVGAEIISIVGIGGRLKGLPLIFTAYNEDTLKRYAAQIIDVLITVNNLSNEPDIRDFVLSYYEKALFFMPITKNIGLFAIIKDSEKLIELKQWYYKYEAKLRELFHEQN